MWVNDRMEECRARRQVLILDCCFSSAFARGAKSAEAFGLDQFTEPGRGRAVLTASNATECSFETPITGQPTPDSPAPGSIFTRPFLAGLRDGSADRDGDGFVTVDEAYAYAYQQLRASGVAQTPQRWLSGGEGQLLLARNPAGLVVIPAALPDSLRAALDSPWPNVRIGAVEELRDWLISDDPDPARVFTATRELKAVADNGTPHVAATAHSALEHTRPLGPTTSPSGPSTIQPGGSADIHAVNRGEITIDDPARVVGRPTGMPPSAAGRSTGCSTRRHPRSRRWKYPPCSPTPSSKRATSSLTQSPSLAEDRERRRRDQGHDHRPRTHRQYRGQRWQYRHHHFERGPMTGTIPDGLVGHDVQDVEAALDDLEFTNVQKSKAKSEDPNTQPGEVISIFPEEGSTVPLDSKITIRYATE
jgi:hypothetical protein